VSDRVILALKYTRAGTASQVRKAVGGFLRYVQHRDLHPTQAEGRPRREVSGLLKYVAYRDRSNTRAELFGPNGTLGSSERKAFAAFVAGAIEGPPPQLYRGRNGEMQDRRRAVYRMVISPERASGLDLRSLTGAAVAGLERESGANLRWIAAIHRNTTHHHVHLVLAGMREDERGGFARVDITKSRLAAMKAALGLEIKRQRGERKPSKVVARPVATGVQDPESAAVSSRKVPDRRAPLVRFLPSRHPLESVGASKHKRRPDPAGRSILALRAAARRYQRRMEHELEIEARRLGRERAA